MKRERVVREETRRVHEFLTKRFMAMTEITRKDDGKKVSILVDRLNFELYKASKWRVLFTQLPKSRG